MKIFIKICIVTSFIFTIMNTMAYTSLQIGITKFKEDENMPVQHSNGYNASLAFGYYFLKNQRFETELFYQSSSHKNKRAARGNRVLSFNTSITDFGAMANYYRDFIINNKLRPFLGFGLGVFGSKSKQESKNTSNSHEEYGTGAAQACAGINFKTSKYTNVFLRYKIYLNTNVLSHSFNLGIMLG